MGIVAGLKSLFSAQGRAEALYQRGLKKAKKDDFESAIRDYTAALASDGLPADVRAMALFNRGLAYSITKDETNARKDLEAVLGIQGAPASVLSAAREKLERIRRRARE